MCRCAGRQRRRVEVTPVSDELEPLRQVLDTVGGHLQDLRAEQSQTVQVLSQTVQVAGELQRNVGELQRNVGELQRNVGELQRNMEEMQASMQRLQARAANQEATMIALGGSFASIDQILTRLFADKVENQAILRGLQLENQELKGTLSDLLRRVEALERRAS